MRLTWDMGILPVDSKTSREERSTTACNNDPPLQSWATYNGSNMNRTYTDSASNAFGRNPVYDAASGLTSKGGNTYLYDAEGRICAVHDFLTGLMTGYLYDAEGNRVAKGTITSWSCDTTLNANGQPTNGLLVTASYILDQAGQQLTEMTWSGNQAAFGYTNVRAAGQLIASYTPGTGNQVVLNFQLRDWLGTLRAQTDSAGTVQERCESLPYGNGQTCVNLDYLFTGKERDAESGNDYFPARYYSSSMGR